MSDAELVPQPDFLSTNAGGVEMAISLEHATPEPGNDLLANLYNGGVNLARQHRVEEALKAFKDIVKDYPGHARAQNWYAVLCAQTGDMERARRHMKEAIRLDPDNMMYLNNLGALLVVLGDRYEAEGILKRVVESRPDYVEALENYGLVKLQQGYLDEALKIYKDATTKNPRSIRGWCNLIFAKDFDPNCTPLEALQLRLQFNNIFKQQARTEWKRDPSPDRPLKVGYVSGDFCMHSAAFCFGAPAMGHKGLGRPENETPVISYAYSSTPEKPGWVDDITNKFKALVHHWVPVVGKRDEELAEIIEKDEIDILVDLSAYSRYGRPITFLMKPAPIQVTAWGHAQGTGWGTVDYLLSDEWTIPPPLKQFHREQVVYMPSVISFAPAEYATPMPECPFTMTGTVKFCSFNRLVKMTPPTLDAWAKILHECPQSTLMLKESSLQDSQTESWVVARFAERGINANRLEILGQTTHVEHLHGFAECDLSLDPYPHGGGVTMLEGLWMGVPAITLVGERIPSRLAYSFYNQLAKLAPEVPWLDLFVATTWDEYVEKAVKLARDPAPLIPIRKRLRADMDGTAMLDHTGYTLIVESAYREMWRRYLASK